MVSTYNLFLSPECRVTILLCRAIGWTRSGAGPFRSPVQLHGTLYWIVWQFQQTN